MRLLSQSVLVLALVASGGIQVAAAAPPSRTDHGVDEEEFPTLWSGDDDRESAPDRVNASLPSLASATDVPFDDPPKAVERWNRGDHQESPDTSVETSIHPDGVTLEDGQFVKDAYATVFAIQPSTRARVRPDWQPLQVAPDGEVLGTVDYRVAVPEDDTSGDREVYWSLSHHEITATRLRVGNIIEARQAGSHTPSLTFTSLDDYRGNEHTLTLEATIYVEVQKRTIVDEVECETVTEVTTTNNTTTTREVVECDTERTEEVETEYEYVTVRDEVDIVVYDLSITGQRARYPNGDLGLAIHANRPWRSYSVAGDDVNGPWRFYSARDPRWDTLTTETESGSESRASPLQPLQVSAYPIDGGPVPPGEMRLLEVSGPEVPPPTLPDHVELDSRSDPYTASDGLVVRGEPSDAGTIRATGLVRGMSREIEPAKLETVPINESNLTLTVTDQGPETVTVEASLRDAGNGAPIETRLDGGEIVISGEGYETSSAGTVTATVPKTDETIHARYEPGEWWNYRQGYVGDTDTVHTTTTAAAFVGLLFNLAVPVSAFLVAGILVGRIFGWNLWPPWRGL